MKVFYLSTTAFADTDVTLVHHLAEHHELIFGVLIPFNNQEYPESQLKAYCLKHKLNFHFFLLKHRRRNPLQIFKLFNVVLAIKKNKPDVIYINNYSDIYLNLLFLLFLNKKFVLVVNHDVENHSGIKAKIFFDIGSFILTKKFNKYLTFSKTQGDILRTKLKNKIVFSIPFAPKDFGPKVNIENNYETIRFLFFGNIKAYKGLDILLKSVEILDQKYRNFKLEIAGRSDDWDNSYEHLIKTKEFLDLKIRYIHNEEIPEIFSRAHYLILPYRDVTQSGPLMIAYNYGLPIIASNLEGFKEFIKEGETGFLFNPADELSLVNTMEAALERKFDEYKRLVNNVIEYRENNFSVKNMIASHNKMLNEIYQLNNGES